MIAIIKMGYSDPQNKGGNCPPCHPCLKMTPEKTLCLIEICPFNHKHCYPPDFMYCNRLVTKIVRFCDHLKQWCSERKETFPLSGKLSFFEERKGKAFHFFRPGKERERKGDFQEGLNSSFSEGVPCRSLALT